ncbi:hypothetical protein [Pseudoclavibacter helvolus]|uniref:hypothetical protein n=1 Tax=Pseudoclavibacter helvolus TaxID=255205 RepID=UPI00083886EA|nr:hypothetical protein [Pseudoclavibacter helvolus]
MNFTVIDNPSTAPTPLLGAPRAVETGDAIGLLTDRQFHVVGRNMRGEAPLIQASIGGAILVGDDAAANVTSIRAAVPELPLLVEPRSLRKHLATDTRPFQLTATTLSGDLDQQRAYSDLAITPTGQIRPGDSDALKAALREANKLDRVDTMFAIPAYSGWLSNDQYVKQLIAVINRSVNPVLLAFIDGHNPVGSMKRARAYRRIFQETTVPVVAHRADLVGIDALAHGAIASAIGSYPSTRRLNPFNHRGGPISDPEGMSPHMLLTDMLRIVRSVHMRREWFAGMAPIQCFCVICRGADVDRLYEDESERRIGHNHNVVSLDGLYSSYVGLSTSARRALWADQVQGALDTYPQLESYLGRDLTIDPILEKVWAAVS